ncbi:MAG: FecR domain-containing protein [Deltaproteobacteria bacterium]|nr:FecR domain-containing protein [Deltaproteobacteria bacterium]
MTDEFKDVDELIEAMQERGRTLPPLEMAGFEETMAMVARLRRRRRLLWGAVTLGAAGVAAVVGALVLQGPTPPPEGGGAAPAADLAVVPPPAGAPGRELRPLVQPLPDVVAFADEAARVTFPSSERVVLGAGMLALQVGPIHSPSRLIIETPAATVAITGTVLAVRVEPDGTGVEVLRGRVEVTRGGRTTVVEAGQELRPGAPAPERLPEVRSATLSALFLQEPPTAPAAVVAAAPSVDPAAQNGSPGPTGRPVVPLASSADEPENTPPATSAEAPDMDQTYRMVDEAMRERRYGDARVLLETVLAFAPAGGGREETALVELADVCRRLGDVPCERRSLALYLERHPSGAFREEARVDLCRSFEQSGPVPELHSCLRLYLDEFPEGRKAKRARELLDGPAPGRPEGDGV